MSNRPHNGSVSSRESHKSNHSDDSGVVLDLDPDFIPVKVKVFRNGDVFDTGTEIPVTRREFKHWFGFLDFVSKKIKSLKSVQKLCTLKGKEVEGFDELEENGQYVAVADTPFKSINYGTTKPLKWAPALSRVKYQDPHGIDSHESLEIHLRKLGFESESGNSFPDDKPPKTSQGKSRSMFTRTPRSEKSSISLPKINQNGNIYHRSNSLRPDDNRRSQSVSRDGRHRSSSRDRRGSYREVKDDYDRSDRRSRKYADDDNGYYDDGDNYDRNSRSYQETRDHRHSHRSHHSHRHRYDEDYNDDYNYDYDRSVDKSKNVSDSRRNDYSDRRDEYSDRREGYYDKSDRDYENSKR